jgi:hypothetical protein
MNISVSYHSPNPAPACLTVTTTAHIEPFLTDALLATGALQPITVHATSRARAGPSRGAASQRRAAGPPPASSMPCRPPPSMSSPAHEAAATTTMPPEAVAPWRRDPRCFSASDVWRPAFSRWRTSTLDSQPLPRPPASWPEHSEEEERRREKSKNKWEKILVMKFEVELCNGWMLMNVVMNVNLNYAMDGWLRMW